MTDRIHWTEELFEARLNRSHYTGVRVGIENSISSLKRAAGDAYAAEETEQARALMDAAKYCESELLADAKRRADQLADELRQLDDAENRGENLDTFPERLAAALRRAGEPLHPIAACIEDGDVSAVVGVLRKVLR